MIRVVSDIANSDNVGAGFLSQDQQIFASYWHGLMDTPQALNAIITWASDGDNFDQVDYQALREQIIDALANSLEQEFDWVEYEEQLSQFKKTRFKG
jgi:adenosylcobyric acid synthase